MHWRYCSLALNHWHSQGLTAPWNCGLVVPSKTLSSSVQMMTFCLFIVPNHQLNHGLHSFTWTIMENALHNWYQSPNIFNEPNHFKMKLPKFWQFCTGGHWVNSLAPGRTGCHFKTANFNLVLLIVIFTSSKDNALRWMPRKLTDDKSTLVQVMARCRQATSHYLSQCWLRSMSPNGVSRPQWVKTNPSFHCSSRVRRYTHYWWSHAAWVLELNPLIHPTWSVQCQVP